MGQDSERAGSSTILTRLFLPRTKIKSIRNKGLPTRKVSQKIIMETKWDKERKHVFTEKKLKSIFFKIVSNVILISALLFLASCIQSPSSTRRSLLSSNNTTTNTPTKLPTFVDGNNFIQNGGVIYSTVVNFDLSFADTLQLRGKDVDSYIRNTGTQNITCVTGRFTASTVNQINITAAIPHSVYNFTTQTLEYYYSLAPSDEITNKNFCQKSGLINSLYALYPTLTPAYKMGALCPNGICVSSVYTSMPLEIYSQSGTAITQIATRQLTYTITNQPNISTPVGKTCVSNAECAGQGYDCCSLGQCVKDLALKPGVDKASTNYVQALQDILNNPSHIYLYPQYYYLCSNSVTVPTTPTTPTNPTNVANTRLKNLTDLYNCTTKIEGEMGICTKTIPNALAGVIYSSGVDDRSFSGTYTNLSSSSYAPTAKQDLMAIQEISYGEVPLFNYDQIASDSLTRPDPYIVSNYLTINGHHNDDNSTGATVTLTSLPANAVSQDLVIKYKIDASCVQINTTLAKCEKYYIQGQQKSGDTIALNRRGRVTDHYPASNSFRLPTYASTNKTIVVEVDGITQKLGIDWQLNAVNPASIEFFPSSTGGLRVFDTQKVKITYFVDLTASHVMDSKLAALQAIKTTCHCADLNCALAPVKNTAGTITDYSCVYPDPAPVVPPISQIVYLSAKTVPVRYFDETGVSVASVVGSTPPQEGTAFSYRKDNLLNPSNVPDITNPSNADTYVGFNEIYGSLSYASNSAKPAKEVPVTKGKIYDIFVDNGTYSNCIQCGNDYYSQLNKLFPLTQFGGGLIPLQSRTDRTQANGVRADDMSFGRACFVPATMIPWSHSISSDPQTQRKDRMRAQHFLYANGYQHDWYGFDYGSVIGSFDGVKWFAIGSNRRIKADSNKLFIAVNGPFGDLALDSTYTVTINDGSLNPIGSNMVTTDFDSDGARCQKFHQCTTDNDCATTLGWDYACANVNDVTTSWPRFDDNGKEIPDAMRDDNRLVSILGMSSSGKRCVYRGRGSACSQNYSATAITAAQNSNSTFNLTMDPTSLACSSNNYCQTITTGNTLNANFNNRIARFGKVRTDAASDSFGLGAKITGRPMEFNAVETMRSETIKSFNSNKIVGLCIPGKSPEVDTFNAQNSTAPSPDYMGDKIVGIGMTYRKNATPVTGVPTYLATCAVMDNTKNYYYAKSDPTLSISGNPSLINDSATQSISTNALNAFSSIFNSKGVNFPLYSNNSTVINSLTFTENRCLRAPGASCFSDTDCAPSKAIADKIKMLSTNDANVTLILNPSEVKFWQEELVCSQATSKSDPTYSASNNRCCREVGKTISLPSADITNQLKMDKAPGVDIPIADKYRYSRVATVYKDIKDTANYPVLQTAVTGQCAGAGCFDSAKLNNQFKTFSAFAERTSCSGDWIRNFNTGNHIWDKAKLQSFNPLMFRCMNWLPGDNGGTSWSCAGLPQNDPLCAMIQTSPYSKKAKDVMNILAKLELAGIPQIAIESELYSNQTTDGPFSCRSNPGSQNDQTYPGGNPGNGKYMVPTQLYMTANASTAEFIDNLIAAPNNKLYSAAEVGHFQNIRQIFKSDEVVSCYPAGTLMTVGADPNLCCTGFINSKTNMCQLQDFVDISVYTNRYVSSEAKKVSSTLIDQNGYIKDPSYVAQLACQQKMCASGSIAYGILISKLPIPGQETTGQKLFRFMEGNTKADDANGLLSIYNNGLKLNTHAYCYPQGSSAGQGDLTIITCP